MGSTAKATVTGFICRLCSEQKKVVTHLYTNRAKKLRLMEKIKLLPISVDKYDNLPKSICDQCVSRLEAQYDLLQKIRRSNTIHHSHRQYHSNGRCPIECPLHGLDDPPLSEVDAEESE
ncbi:hypothetical protein NQ315_005527 [Exocentrus adspersus]|uniref:ZAD domain-containing protein n=1 Tax=Exocentrus adspersus TaxID=1586481 RepID=A0AAV8VU95_9CUCU|nr:hypothetical protein NQ315_005527 [Exocentrus adspersus]